MILKSRVLNLADFMLTNLMSGDDVPIRQRRRI